MAVNGCVLAIDPGTEKSAWVHLRHMDGVTDHGYDDNSVVLEMLEHCSVDDTVLAVEMIASYGMSVGREVFETCVWIGRFVQAWGGKYVLVYRRDVKMHLCGNNRAKDANVRQALIDRYGPGKEKAVGTKKRMGPLHGISGDQWSALAVAVTYIDGAVPQRLEEW